MINPSPHNKSQCFPFSYIYLHLIVKSHYIFQLCKFTDYTPVFSKFHVLFSKIFNFVKFLLNNKNEILKNINTAIGGSNFANINMQEIIGEALKIKAPKMILVHNHPTGDPTPSKADITFTDRLYNAAKMFDIELLDHIIIGNDAYKSIFVETKKIAEKLRKQNTDNIW